jgi:hypothetical protein
MRFTIAALLLTGSLALPTTGAAHPGHEHKLMGTIATIDGQNITIKTTDGKERTFAVTSVTKVLNGKQKSDARELKVGMRVAVNVGDGAEPLKAKEIQYAATAAATKDKQ